MYRIYALFSPILYILPILSKHLKITYYSINHKETISRFELVI
jgi:hypothetical protein